MVTLDKAKAKQKLDQAIKIIKDRMHELGGEFSLITKEHEIIGHNDDSNFDEKVKKQDENDSDEEQSENNEEGIDI